MAHPPGDVVGTLLATRGRALTAYGYLLCGDVHDAEDLVQDAVVKVFVRGRSGVALESAEAYVRRTMLTIFLDGRRRRARWLARRHLVAEAATTAGPSGPVDDRLDVVAALATLPRQQRACVVLRFYEDLTVPEIAERLGVADGTVKRYLSTGTRALEATLGPLVPPAPTVDVLQEG